MHGITSMKKHIENEHPYTLVQYKKKLKIVDEFGQCVRQKREEKKNNSSYFNQ